MIVLVLGLTGPLIWGQPVSLDRQAAQVEHRNFDPSSPPAAMPKLSGNEAAITQSRFGISARVRVEVLGESKDASGQTESSVRVQSVGVTTILKITVWLPYGASEHLQKHEEAHKTISEHYYRDAEAVAKQQAQGLIGKTYKGRGATAEEARKEAIRQAIGELSKAYLARTEKPAARANDIFDNLTQHGEKRNVLAKDAILMAIEQAQGSARGVLEEETPVVMED